MRLKKFSRLIYSVFLLILLKPAGLYANVNISFDIATFNFDENTRMEGKPKSVVYGKSILLIGRDFFQFSENNLDYIYDFGSRKIFVIDRKRKIYEERSLYASLAFRSAEMENRLMIYDNLRHRKFREYLRPVILEHNFSISTGRGDEKISTHALRNETVYQTADGRRLMHTSGSTNRISENEILIFSKFLRYKVGGHPEIIRKIIEGSAIPASLTMYAYDEQGRKQNFRLTNFKKLPDSSYSLAGLKAGPVQFTGKFIEFARQAALEAPINAPVKFAAVEAEIQEAADKKHYLDAVLGCMEMGLYYSHLDIPVCKTNLEKLQANVEVKTFFNNLNLEDKQKSESNYNSLKKLESVALNKAYILWIFEANLMTRMDKPAAAFELYQNSLKGNPYLAGVYKDLGEMYYNNFKMDMAWLCWDTGRKIYREHSLLREIDKLEETLAVKYPDFF